MANNQSTSPAIQQQIDKARRTLYDLNRDGSIANKSELFQRYEANAEAYAKAKSQYAERWAKVQSDPVALQAWPLTGVTYRQPVDSAWDDWASQGKAKVESALAVIKTFGNSAEIQLTQQQNH